MDNEEREHLQRQVAQYSRNLHRYEILASKHGGYDYAPSVVQNQIDDTRHTLLELNSKLDVFRLTVDLSEELQEEFAGESSAVRKFVSEKPLYWEHLLLIELLRPRFARLRREMKEVRRGLRYARTRPMKGSAFLDWAEASLEDLLKSAAAANILINEDIMAALGPLGQHGDPLAIKRVVEHITVIGDQWVEWELELRSISPSPVFQRCRELMEGWTANLLEDLGSLLDQLEDVFKVSNPEGTFAITVELREHAKLKNLLEEMERLAKDPRILSGDF